MMLPMSVSWWSVYEFVLFCVFDSGFYDTLVVWLMQAVVRPNGGHAVVLNWSMFTLYGVNKHEVSSSDAKSWPVMAACFSFSYEDSEWLYLV